MSRNTEYRFIDMSAEDLEARMISEYQKLTGVTVQPGSPERLFIAWVQSVILQVEADANYIGNQNVPSRAEGENLDALADLFYLQERPEASPATVTMEFTISEPQETSILIPQGTRVTDDAANIYWDTMEDAYVQIGETTATVHAQCESAGTIGNGYALGQISTCVDIFDYYTSCQNITVSDGGSDVPDDDEFYELLRESMDAYSTAGPSGSYSYHAKLVSTEIEDVVVNSPTPGEVRIYVLMNDGTIAGEEIKDAVYEECNADSVRPLTDLVIVGDAETREYNIDATYYINRDSTMSSSEIQNNVNDAVQLYIAWQCGKLGRDINPSRLIGYLMAAGVKRVEVREPVFTELKSGNISAADYGTIVLEDTIPEIAQVADVTVINGGYEDE